MRYSRMLQVSVLALCVGVAACGDDDPTSSAPPAPPTPEPDLGPPVTFFGILRADDTLIEPSTTTPEGVPVYSRAAGSGFRLVVEGKPGASGQAVGQSTYQADLTSFPDLQIQVSRPLGNGSAAVCDVSEPSPGPGAPPPGGVPAIAPASFALTQTAIDTVNDLGCRFRDGAGNPGGVGPADACVKMLPGEDYAFVDPESTIEFCGFISGLLTFPPGDTVVTARLRDVAGNTGTPAQVVIRIGS